MGEGAVQLKEEKQRQLEGLEAGSGGRLVWAGTDCNWLRRGASGPNATMQQQRRTLGPAGGSGGLLGFAGLERAWKWRGEGRLGAVGLWSAGAC